MNFTNKHIVLILIIIIIVVFIYNYDVYIVPKNEPICKPVYITKRELNPEQRAELNSSQTVIFKESFSNLLDNKYFEGFESMNDLIPPKNLSNYSPSFITDPNKIRVVDSVIKVLSYIPTNSNEKQMQELLEYYIMIYQSSSDLENFYENVAKSTKITEEPYNSKYSHLILFLIGKFHSDLDNCHNPNGVLCETGIASESSFNLKPEDIPELIQNYYVKKEEEQLAQSQAEAQNQSSESESISESGSQSQNEYSQEQLGNSSDYLQPSNTTGANGESKKYKKKKKRVNNQKVLDELIAQKIQQKINQESNYSLRDVQTTGAINLNDGPSSRQMSESIDRSALSTRNGLNNMPDIRTQLQSDSENVGGESLLFNPGRFGVRKSNSDCKTCDGSNMNSANSGYYYKSFDNLGMDNSLNHMNSIESFNSEFGGYSDYANY